MPKKLGADELSWFANKFMLDFAETSIAIENFSNETYGRFYGGFLDIFKDFLANRLSFDATGALSKTYDDFHHMIESYIPDDQQTDGTSPLRDKPGSGSMCVGQLGLLRRLEER